MMLFYDFEDYIEKTKTPSLRDFYQSNTGIFLKHSPKENVIEFWKNSFQKAVVQSKKKV